MEQLTEEVAKDVAASPQEWMRFLNTASRLYKYTFPEQLLIYAQRPEATAVASMEIWNQKMYRWIKKGSKGIALIDNTSGPKTKLRYVFDVQDTYKVRNLGKDPQLWNLPVEGEHLVADYLQEQLSLEDTEGGLAESLHQAAKESMQEWLPDALEELRLDVTGTFLEELDEQNQEVEFRELMTNSVWYVLLNRCGLDVQEYLDAEDFRHITDFNQLKILGHLGSAVNEIRNIIVVILNKAKLLFFSEFVKKERSYQKECAELDIQYAVFDQIGSLFSSIIRVFIYTYGGMKIIKSQMTMGELIAFIEYTTLFINPCIRILKSNASIQKLKVSINRIYDFLEMKNSIAQNNYGIKIRNRINEIVFDNVSFSYDKKMVIENLSFKLERGKTYAFVGETGCGKSTIVNLLFRLWDTKSGNIMIDGENIKEYNLFSLRKQLSIATQNVYIKDDSIENNILMGRKKEDCAYDEICKLVGMESILSKFPKEKDVSVGENGNKLSGGQKQRIAMARALVHADNVLILDEATSALDNITQNEIMKNIKPLYQDKIVIIITHRLDTISDVDKIFVMSEGRICEEGQHNELMKKGEKYYALVQNL